MPCTSGPMCAMAVAPLVPEVGFGIGTGLIGFRVIIMSQRLKLCACLLISLSRITANHSGCLKLGVCLLLSFTHLTANYSGCLRLPCLINS